MKQLLHYIKNPYILLLIVVDLVVFTTFNPRTAPSIVVVVGFLLMALTVYVLCMTLLNFAAKHVVSLRSRKGRIGLMLSVCISIVIGLQSIGQLSTKDLLAIVPLLAVVYFYLSYYRKDSGRL